MRKFIQSHISGFVLIVLLTISMVVLWTSEQTSLGSPREAGMILSSLVQSSIDETGNLINSTINSFNELGELRKQYELLSQKYQTLERQQSDLAILNQENLRLKQALGFSLELEYRNIPAQIIAKEPGMLFSAFVINKGYNDGVRNQMPVICIMDGTQCLVGKIGSVSSFSSQVVPLFDRRNNVAARLVNNRYEGLLQGSGAYTDKLQMVYMDPKAQSSIQIGDMVCTSGLSSLYPSDIPIGRVSAFSVKPHAATLELEVEPLVDYTRLEYVYVLAAQRSPN